MYNFKKQTKVFLVRSGLRYDLPVYPDISFSQTFNETSIPIKTLHSAEDFIDSAVITEANPANFSFTIPILTTSHYSIVFELLNTIEYRNGIPSLKEFDLYVQSTEETYRVQQAVIDSGIIQFDTNNVMLLSISGTAARYYNVTGTSIPGTLVDNPTNYQFGIIRAFEAQIDSTPLDMVTAFTVELKNNVIWLPSDSIHYTTDGYDSTKYPSINILQGKTISGTLEHYVNPNAKQNDWKIGSSLLVKGGLSSSNYLVEVDIPQTVFTTRVTSDDIIKRGIDFRAISNSPSMVRILQS